MFSKINTKWLAGIFLALLLLAIIVLVRNNSKSGVNRNRTFTSQLTDFDTAKISTMMVYPKTSSEPIQFNKEGGRWEISIDGKKYNADEGMLKGMISNLHTLNAIRIAGKGKDQWTKYEVTDSLATRVQLMTDKKKVADVYLGKFSYKQPKNSSPYMQQQGMMTSYVRIEGDKNVYAVEGIIGMTFNRRPGDFRNKILVKSQKERWNRLTFMMQEETYSLTKQGDNWMVGGLMADSAAVARYLSSIAWLSNSDFIDYHKDNSSPSHTLSIEGENMSASIKILAFVADTVNQYAITSSMNEGTYFSGGKSGLFDKIFVSKEHFFPEETEKTEEEK
jgi:hypothetical protein